MKTNAFLHFLMVCAILSCGVLFPLELSAQQVWNYYGEPEKGITVTGIVKGDVGSPSSGSIRIMRNGKLYNEVYPGPGGKYEAELPFGDDYELEFSIPGCVTKRIKVETNLDEEVQKLYDEPLAFNMSLPKATLGPLDEAYDLPVSRLYFDNSKDLYDRDMVTEEVFRSHLKAKQAEHKRWLEEQKQKTDEEKEKEEAKKKAEEEAKRLAEEAAARQKAEELAKRKAEEEARRKAAEEAARLAAAKKQEEEFRKKQDAEALRLAELAKKKREEDSLFRVSMEQKLAQKQADEEAQRKLKEEADLALWQKLNDKTAELKAIRDKEIADSLFNENERIRLENERALAEQEALRKAEQDLIVAEQIKEIEVEKEIAQTGYGGAGRSVFYDYKITERDLAIDLSATERARNWERKRQERVEAYNARRQRQKEEGIKISRMDAKRQAEVLAIKQRAEERRKEFAERERLKEMAAEEIRRSRLAESLNKKVVVLVAYSTGSNTNSKFYGYVNFGDGKGPLELTEAEYREMASRFSGIYNKQ